MLFKLKICPLLVATVFSLIGCNSDSIAVPIELVKEQSPAYIEVKSTTKFTLSQLQSGVTFNMGDWLQDGIEDTLQTDVAIRTESKNDFLVSTTFRQPVQLGVAGFDATGYGRFLMCFANDLAERSQAQYWLLLTPKTEQGLSYEKSKVHHYLIGLIRESDPIISFRTEDGQLKAMQERYPLYDVSERNAYSISDPLFRGQYCSFYRSNFVN